MSSHHQHAIEKHDDHRPNGAKSDDEWDGEYDLCSQLIIIVAHCFVFLTFPFTFFLYFRVVKQYERAVIFRLGRLRSGGARGPGLFFVVPFVDKYCKVDLRVMSFQVPPQEILSKDSVTVEVDAVVYFRIFDATISVVNVENAKGSTKLLAQTTLRNILGTKTLSEMLANRENISAEMQTVLDHATEPWGVKVQRVEVKDIRLPRQLQRAMAAEAEANREANAKVIAANGESRASESLRQAAKTMSEYPAALQLRYLQTLHAVSAEHNSTILFPLPMDILSAFMPKAPQLPQQPPLPQRQPLAVTNASASLAAPDFPQPFPSALDIPNEHLQSVRSSPAVTAAALPSQPINGVPANVPMLFGARPGTAPKVAADKRTQQNSTSSTQVCSSSEDDEDPHAAAHRRIQRPSAAPVFNYVH